MRGQDRYGQRGATAKRLDDFDGVRDSIHVLVEAHFNRSVLGAILVRFAVVCVVRRLEVPDEVVGALEEKALVHVDPVLAFVGGEADDGILSTVGCVSACTF
jgi:hypothetical protein